MGKLKKKKLTINFPKQVIWPHPTTITWIIEKIEDEVTDKLTMARSKRKIKYVCTYISADKTGKAEKLEV